MLIGFKVKNYKSIRDLQYVSFQAGQVRINNDHHTEINNKKFLKFSCMYGANGSGKSNLISSIRLIQTILNNNVESIHKDLFYKGDKNLKNEISYFEYEFVIDNKFYSYGFEINLLKKEITSEWLMDMTKSSGKVIFSRDIVNGSIQSKFNRKTSIASSCIDEMKKNNKELFLSEIVRRLLIGGEIKEEYELLIKISNFFLIDMTIITPSEFKVMNDNILVNKEKILKILKKFDINIVDIIESSSSFDEINKDMTDIDIKNMRNSINLLFAKSSDENAVCTLKKGNEVYLIKKNDNEYIVSTIKYKHEHSDNLFNAYEESDGTIRIIDLIDIFFSENKIFIIDEIDRSLHPLLLKSLIKLYLEENICNQLFITTHDINLLDLNLIRRDEVWFSEKNEKGITSFYSLEEFKQVVRFDKVISKAYMEGRFGAVAKLSE